MKDENGVPDDPKNIFDKARRIIIINVPKNGEKTPPTEEEQKNFGDLFCELLKIPANPTPK